MECSLRERETRQQKSSYKSEIPNFMTVGWRKGVEHGVNHCTELAFLLTPLMPRVPLPSHGIQKVLSHRRAKEEISRLLVWVIRLILLSSVQDFTFQAAEECFKKKSNRRISQQRELVIKGIGLWLTLKMTSRLKALFPRALSFSMAAHPPSGTRETTIKWVVAMLTRDVTAVAIWLELRIKPELDGLLWNAV